MQSVQLEKWPQFWYPQRTKTPVGSELRHGHIVSTKRSLTWDSGVKHSIITNRKNCLEKDY